MLLVESEEEATVVRLVGLFKAVGVTGMVSIKDSAVERENEVIGIYAAGAAEKTVGVLLIVIVIVPGRPVSYVLSVSLMTIASCSHYCTLDRFKGFGISSLII